MGNCCDIDKENIKCKTKEEYLSVINQYLDLFMKEKNEINEYPRESNSFTNYMFKFKVSLVFEASINPKIR